MMNRAAQQRNHYKATWAIIGIALVFVVIIGIVVACLGATGVLPATSNAPASLTGPSNSTDQPATSTNSQGNRARFNIDLRYLTPTSSEIIEIFEQSKARWEEVITNDVDTLVVIQAGTEICGMKVPTTEDVDDLIIYINVAEIDGVGNVLANAGPCGLDSLGRVRAGIMNFDLADLNRLIENGRAKTVVLHEMGHVLGFGTLWETRGLIKDQGWFAKQYFYSGENGNLGNEEVGLSGPAVIEETGGVGTARSHWKESVYGSELMTGYITDNGPAPLSALTVRSFADLGYSVDITNADPFRVHPIEDDEAELPYRLRGSAPQYLELEEPEEPAQTEPSDTSGSTNVTESRSPEKREEYGDDVLRFPVTVLPSFPKHQHSGVKQREG